MTATTWTLGAADGELLIHTGVTGRAANFGHRLTLAMTSWQATVWWTGDHPAVVELSVDVDSLQVRRGDGGLTPMAGPEKALARSNALRSLDAARFPVIRFRADDIGKTSDGYRLTGTLDIHGQTRGRAIDVHVDNLGDAWRFTGQSDVRQSEFGVKPYSLLMGSVKVVDDVTVTFNISHRQ